MFTECPECSIGFRVTAKVLQQAGGRVRCGGCGHAFSALDHLTEESPDADFEDDAPPPDTDADDLTSDEKFRETSRQLLKTLNQLAGPEDVRIEDTGFEWQVLDDDEPASADAAGTEDIAADAGSGDAAITDEPLELEVVSEIPANDELFDDSGDDEENIATATDIEGVEEDVDAEDIPLEVEEELAAIHSELSAKDKPEPVDLDSQFDNQAEAMGLEISGSHDVAEDEEITVVDSLEEDDAEADAAEDDREEVAANLTPPEDTTAADQLSEEDAAIAAAYGAMEGIAEEAEDAAEKVVEEKDEAAGRSRPSMGSVTHVHPVQDAEIDQQSKDVAAAFVPDAEAIELSMEDSDATPESEPENSGLHKVPEMSEEEMTINLQIDQELLAVAVADKDKDFTATIVGLENAEKMFEEETQGVETIIMEGDVVRGAMEREAEKEKRARALKRFDGAGNLIDSYIARRAVRGGRRSTDPAGYGLMALIAILVLGLAAQVVHANRQSLSTTPFFNQTIGQVYRLLGDPVTPEWSITGWQFEATNGSVAADQDVLTISSRIGNKSEQPLPFPLVHVSLTDRFEEIIGSAVLDPSDYLAGDLSPGQLVTPGGNFTAVITVDQPSVDATGFKLNVCYRVSPGRVRCATEDFKD